MSSQINPISVSNLAIQIGKIDNEGHSSYKFSKDGGHGADESGKKIAVMMSVIHNLQLDWIKGNKRYPVLVVLVFQLQLALVSLSVRNFSYRTIDELD